MPLNLVVIRLVRECKKSHMDIPNHTGLYKLSQHYATLVAAVWCSETLCELQGGGLMLQKGL